MKEQSEENGCARLKQCVVVLHDRAAQRSSDGAVWRVNPPSPAVLSPTLPALWTLNPIPRTQTLTHILAHTDWHKPTFTKPCSCSLSKSTYTLVQADKLIMHAQAQSENYNTHTYKTIKQYYTYFYTLTQLQNYIIHKNSQCTQICIQNVCVYPNKHNNQTLIHTHITIICTI